VVYPEVSPEEWAKRYQIDISKKGECHKCKAVMNWTKPFAHGKMRGFISDHTSCGEEYRGAKMVSVDKEFNAVAQRLFESMK
jgi:hypothetical protein